MSVEPPKQSLSLKLSPLDPRLLYVVPPISPDRFSTIDLPLRSPQRFYEWPESLIGLVIIYNTPFLLKPVVDENGKVFGHQVIEAQPSSDNVTTVEEVVASVKNVSIVHILISAKHGWAFVGDIQFLHKSIGKLELIFADGSKQEVGLVLGKNIREWHFTHAPNLVTSADYELIKPAWVSHDNTRRIDYMSVSVLAGPKDLSSIRVIAKFEDELAGRISLFPAIIISAITCELYRENGASEYQMRK